MPNRMVRKSNIFLYILFTVCFVSNLKAQFIGNYIEKQVSSGADGNYIFLVDDDYLLANQGKMPTPYANGRTIIVERSSTGVDWMVLDTLRPVKNMQEFKEIWGEESAKLVLEDKNYFKFENEAALINHFQNPNNPFYQMYLFPLKLFRTIGFVYKDRTAMKGTTYTYRISYSDTGKVLFENQVNTGEENSILQAYKFNFNQESLKAVDSLVVGTWVYLKNNLRMVNTVKVFGKRTFDTTFEQINEITPSFVGDTLLASVFHPTTPDEAWQVFVQPYDLIGNPGPPSDTATLVSMDIARLPSVKNFTSKDTTTGVFLSWDALPAHSFLSAYILSRTNSKNQFEVLDTLALNVTSYLDYNVQTGEGYNYEIQPLAAPVSNFRTRDFTPVRVAGSHKERERVLPPQRVEVSQTGNNIEISWEPVIDDRLSYYEVVANTGVGSGDYRTIAIVPSSDTTHVDTLNYGDFKHLTRFYAVKSVSYGQFRSQMSNPVTITPMVEHQVNPPNGLVLKKFTNAVKISWEQDFESQNWVKGYHIYRSINQGEWLLLNEDSLTVEREYLDTNLDQIGTYAYQIAGVSITNNVSNLSISQSIYIETAIELEPRLSNVFYRNIPPGIEVSWISISNNKADSIAIYRKGASALDEFKLLATLPEWEKRYWDKSVEVGKTYIYAVEALLMNEEKKQNLKFTTPILRMPAEE